MGILLGIGCIEAIYGRIGLKGLRVARVLDCFLGYSSDYPQW